MNSSFYKPYSPRMRRGQSREKLGCRIKKYPETCTKWQFISRVCRSRALSKESRSPSRRTSIRRTDPATVPVATRSARSDAGPFPARSSAWNAPASRTRDGTGSRHTFSAATAIDDTEPITVLPAQLWTPHLGRSPTCRGFSYIKQKPENGLLLENIINTNYI